ncbi:hypothetical protein JGS22_007745 [Streptomyces sp. P38-E01]|uniref:Uncharacterized protein n=1 Tax=Streptomyces tardus TaxID=2780544 RepID=A0A949JCH0_9ACTN|nr:hypothetical protein [Streptomyces tardus]MBU7597518.1 hypothetical protein [Streptomyces tardus]
MLKLILVLVVVAALVLTMVTSRMARQRREEFSRRFPTYEDFAATVDGSKIRAVRDGEGMVAAVKVVRADFPEASLLDSKRYVDELD